MNKKRKSAPNLECETTKMRKFELFVHKIRGLSISDNDSVADSSGFEMDGIFEQFADLELANAALKTVIEEIPCDENSDEFTLKQTKKKVKKKSATKPLLFHRKARQSHSNFYKQFDSPFSIASSNSNSRVASGSDSLAQQDLLYQLLVRLPTYFERVLARASHTCSFARDFAPCSCLCPSPRCIQQHEANSLAIVVFQTPEQVLARTTQDAGDMIEEYADSFPQARAPLDEESSITDIELDNEEVIMT